MPRHVGICPCCGGTLVSMRCRTCGVAIGTARITKKRRKEDNERTIASAGAEWVGRRSAILDKWAAFDESGLADEADNDGCPGTVVSHLYTSPHPRRGIVTDGAISEE